MIRTMVQLDENQHRELKKLASEEHKSMSMLVRRGIDLLIQSSVSMDEKKRRALEVVGKYHSGINDLAEKHDLYIVESYEEKTR